MTIVLDALNTAMQNAEHNAAIDREIRMLRTKIYQCKIKRAKYEKSKNKIEKIETSYISDVEDELKDIKKGITKAEEKASKAIDCAPSFNGSIRELTEEKTNVYDLKIDGIKSQVQEQNYKLSLEISKIDTEIFGYNSKIRSLEAQKR